MARAGGHGSPASGVAVNADLSRLANSCAAEGAGGLRLRDRSSTASVEVWNSRTSLVRLIDSSTEFHPTNTGCQTFGHFVWLTSLDVRGRAWPATCPS